MTTVTRSDVVSYLGSIGGASGVLSGQNMRGLLFSPGLDYSHMILDLYLDTGEYPAVTGGALHRWDPEFTDAWRENMLWTCVHHWNCGGFVVIDHQVNSPWGGSANATRTAPLSDIIDPAKAVYTAWMNELAWTANLLNFLKEKGVVVIWRPFKECTFRDTWWWNPTTAEWGGDPAGFTAEFIAVWQHMHNYFTTTCGLDNLVWLYSTSNKWLIPLNQFFPGAAYADIVGCTTYTDGITINGTGYAELQTCSKPIAINECGRAYPNSCTFWDNRTAINSIRTNYPAVCWFHFWASWGTNCIAMVDNDNADLLLADAWVVNRGEISCHDGVVGISNDEGDLDAYELQSTDGGDLSVSGAAAIVGTHGLSCQVDDQNSIYGQRYTTATTYVDEMSGYFYVHPHSITMPNASYITLLRLECSGVPNFLFNVTLPYNSGYEIQVAYKNDAGTQFLTGAYDISNAATKVGLHIKRATGAVANDGILQLYIDDVLKETVNNWDNYDAWPTATGFRIGAIVVSAAGISGVFYLDELFFTTAAIPPPAPPAPPGGFTSGFIGSAQRVPSELIDILRPWFIERNESQETWRPILSAFQAIPGLRGLWWSGQFDNAGDCPNLQAVPTAHWMEQAGDPTFNYEDLTPYWRLDGTGDYFYRTDHADFDILGTESYIHTDARGLTLGGWFRATSWPAQWGGLLGKYNSATNDRSYLLLHNNVPTLSFNISNDGTNYLSLVSTGGLPAVDTWFWMVGRFIPSTEQALWVNDHKDAGTTGIYASLRNSAQNLLIGSYNAGTYPFTGDWSLCFVCATALSDSIIGLLWNWSKRLYGY